MILEAFSEVLKREFGRERPALSLLQAWLYEYVSDPEPKHGDMIHRVLLTEIEIVEGKRVLMFQGRSPSGTVLLKSLYDYCRCYEDWQYRRWLHSLQPADFTMAGDSRPE